MTPKEISEKLKKRLETVYSNIAGLVIEVKPVKMEIPDRGSKDYISVKFYNKNKTDGRQMMIEHKSSYTLDQVNDSVTNCLACDYLSHITRY